MLTISSRPLLGRVLPLLIGAGLLALIGANDVHAQSGMRSVEAVSTGGGTSVLGSGPAQLYSNPANLTVGETDHRFTLQLFRFGAHTGGDFFQFNHFTPLFIDNDEVLPNEEEVQILDDWFGSKDRGTATYVEVTPVSMTYRPKDGQWAAGGGIRARAFQSTSLSKGLLDLIFTDRLLPARLQTRLYSTVDVTGAFSYRFSELPLSVGASPRLIFGLGYADADFQVVPGSNGDSYQVDYTARAAGPVSTGLYDSFNLFGAEPVKIAKGSAGVEGVGVGLDLGGTYTVQPDLYVSMSITDLSFVQWTGDAQTATNSFTYEGLTLDLQRLESDFDGDVTEYLESELDSLTRSGFNRDRLSFPSGLPTTLHLSSTWERAPYTLNGGLSIGLNKKAGAVPKPAAIHAGGEVNVGLVPIRAGVRLWGSQAVTLSGGFGLHFGSYEFDLGASVTPYTSFLGGGARYAVSASLATIRF